MWYHWYSLFIGLIVVGTISFVVWMIKDSNKTIASIRANTAITEKITQDTIQTWGNVFRIHAETAESQGRHESAKKLSDLAAIYESGRWPTDEEMHLSL